MSDRNLVDWSASVLACTVTQSSNRDGCAPVNLPPLHRLRPGDVSCDAQTDSEVPTINLI